MMNDYEAMVHLLALRNDAPDETVKTALRRGARALEVKIQRAKRHQEREQVRMDRAIRRVASATDHELGDHNGNY